MIDPKEDDVVRTVDLTGWELRILRDNMGNIAEAVDRHMIHTTENQPIHDRWHRLMEKLK
jgi:uncharacterized protein YigA (DUF484 family)